MRAWALLAVVVMLGVSPGAGSQPPDPNAHIVAGLLAILEEGWHPEPTEPRWLELKPQVESAIALNPAGAIAALARRAAVRVEVTASPIVSIAAHATSFSVDTRPWFVLDRPQPYFVTVHASLDGGQWVEMATAYSGAKCSVSTIDAGWPTPIAFGFHRVNLIADVAFLSAQPRSGNDCSVATHAKAREHARRPRVEVEPRLVIASERRVLPALSFGLHDVRARLTRPVVDGTSTAQDQLNPSYDIFVQAAQRAAMKDLEPGLSELSFATWLKQMVAPYPSDSPQISWTTDYCDPDESMWDRGFDGGQWPATSAARRTARSLCVDATKSLHGRILTVRLKAGTVHEDAGEWKIIAPEFYDARIDGGAFQRGRDFASLSEIPAALAESPDAWPEMRVSVTPLDITVDPPQPLPGQPVTITVEIRNIGGRAIPGLYGTLTIGSSFASREFHRRDFHGAVPLGGSLKVSRTVTLPTASVFATVTVWPFPPGGSRRYVIDTGGGATFRAINTPAPPGGG